MAVDNDADASNQTIDDKYSKGSSRIPASDQEEDKRDAATIKRENFLSIYKEGGDNGDGQDNDLEPDLSQGIKFKRDQEADESSFELKTSAESS